MKIPTDLERVSDAAYDLRMSPRTIYRRFRAGTLKLYGHPGTYRVSLGDLCFVAQPPGASLARSASPRESAKVTTPLSATAVEEPIPPASEDGAQPIRKTTTKAESKE